MHPLILSLSKDYPEPVQGRTPRSEIRKKCPKKSEKVREKISLPTPSFPRRREPRTGPGWDNGAKWREMAENGGNFFHHHS